MGLPPPRSRRRHPPPAPRRPRRQRSATGGHARRPSGRSVLRSPFSVLRRRRSRLPVARQGAPFSVPRSPFSGGGEAASSPLASPAPAIPAGAHIRTKEEQAALRDSLIPAPPPQGTAPLPDDATPQQAFQAFENTLAGKRFITPLGETVSFNEGHFGRVTCAGNPQGSDDPAKRKGFIAGYPSAQAARQALREGKVNADQIQGYQSSRAALIPLIPDIVQHPQYILGHEGAQLFVKRYDIGNGRDILAVFRKFGNDLRPVSLYPTEIHGGKLKESRVLFAENAANLRWSAGIAETGTPPPDTTTIPQSAPFVNPLANPAPGPTPAPGNAAPQGATPVARQGAPFSVPRSPFSGGGEAACRRQIALYAADRAGDPNFANKGILLGQLETFYTGFLNARMKGLSRTAARLKEAPGEFTLKALALLAPSLLAYLLYDGTLKRAVQTLFFDGQEPDEDQQATLAGNLHATLAWEQDALKNVSPYTRLNYFTTPLWMSADKSVTLTLKTPIPEEIKLLHYALTALLNRTTLDTGIPNVGLNDALAEIYGSLAPGSGDRGVAIALLDTWCAPWLSGDNPWQAYRNANQFSDDAFRARLITPMPLIKEQLIDTWNGSPLVTLSRLRRNDQYGNVPQDLQALHTLLQTPIVGPVLARFASIDANGRAQTVGQYLQIAEARKAALRIQAKDTAKTYLQTNTLPDTLKTLPSEEQLYFIDALLDAVKDQALPKSTSAETLRKALNIPFQDLRQPALRATHPNP